MAAENQLTDPCPLEGTHDVTAFDCGVQPLNDYLRKFALANQRGHSARTYVALCGQRFVGYYTLVASSVHHEDAPPRVAKGQAIYPIPIILLGRLAVDQAEKGRGPGKALLKDALLRAIQAADNVGCRAVLTHAKDQSAQAFYRKFGFEPSPTDALHLFLLMKDIKAMLSGPATPP